VPHDTDFQACDGTRPDQLIEPDAEDYLSRCQTGHMVEIAQLHRELVARVLGDKGTAASELRRAAFDNAGLSEPIRTLIEKTANHAYQVTDEDVAAVRVAGLTENQIFEIVVCAAVGQASRQYSSALAALASATDERPEP
jgi:hypothetical protein